MYGSDIFDVYNVLFQKIAGQVARHIFNET